MRVPALALAVSALLPVVASAEVEVHVANDGRVSMRADAPASEVLDRLASRTGMKVVYEGVAPRGRVMVAFEGRTAAEAVLMVLEGLGVDHLMRLDATGTRPELLMLATSSAAPRTLPAASAPAAPAVRPPPPPQDEPMAEDEEPQLDEQPIDETDPAAGAAGAQRPQVPGPRPANAPQGQQQPAAQAPVNRPAFAPSNYPVSPFAPAAPAPPTVILPPTPTPAPESGEPDQ
jgi:hypothetical protein